MSIQIEKNRSLEKRLQIRKNYEGSLALEGMKTPKEESLWLNKLDAKTLNHDERVQLILKKYA